jgi:hypothetical protein
MVGDAYSDRLVGAYLEPHFIARKLHMPDFDRRVGGEQGLAVAFHLQTLWGLGNVIE